MPANSTPPHPSDGDEKDDHPADKRKRFEITTPVVVAAVGAAGVIIAAAVTGFFGLLDKPSTGAPPGPAGSAGPSGRPCPGSRVDVQIPGQVGSNPTLTFHFNCAPVPGSEYLWVVEALDIGKDRHTEFYPKPFDSAIHANSIVSFPLDLQGDTIGEQNCIVVIGPTSAQGQQLLDNLNANSFTLDLPASIDQVSAKACETRVR